MMIFHIIISEKCPEITFGNEMAILSNNCKREPEEECQFLCKGHYRPALNNTGIKCLSGSRWNVSTSNLCEGTFLRLLNKWACLLMYIR